MKALIRMKIILLLAALPAFLSAQTVVIDYMKVTQDTYNMYLEVEKEWKTIHKKMIEEGASNGWQLWRNIKTGFGDEYQFMTINWFDDMTHAMAGPPEGFWDRVSGDISDDLMERTMKSRVLVTREFSHGMISATENHGAKYIQVNYMKTKPGKWNEYVEMEREIFKPVFEESIKQGTRKSWGVWNMWPYDEGDVTLVTVDGFDSFEQKWQENMGELFLKVHPDLNTDDLLDKLQAVREMTEVQVWELVDAVWPEGE